MKRKLISYVLMLLLVALPAVGRTAAAAFFRLGPYNLSLDPSPWQVKESDALNHELHLSLPGNNARIRVIPEFLMAHEIRDRVEEILENSHRLWKEDFEYQNGKVTVLQHEALRERGKATLSVAVAFQADNRRQILKRLYRSHPAHQMILVIEMAAGEDDSQKFENDFSLIERSIEVDESYEVSPCVRVFYLGRQFNRLRDAYVRAESWPDFQESVALYKQDLRLEIDSLHHHEWGHYLMLAYLEAFNSQGVYLGEGTNLKRAARYLGQARKTYPNPDRLKSLTLDDLPELFESGF